MARSKAKSRKTTSNGNDNNTGGGENNDNSNSGDNYQPVDSDPSTSRIGFGTSGTNDNHSQPVLQLVRAEDIRESENSRPMTEDELLAQQLKHLEPYQPDEEPPKLENHGENVRVRITFPKRGSDYNPYVRWNGVGDGGGGRAAEDEEGSSESSKTSSRGGRGRGRKGGGGGGGGRGGGGFRLTPFHGSQGRLSYSLLGVAKENPVDRERQMIYGVAFNQWVGMSADVFATVGDNSVTVYQCHRDLKGGFRGLASYHAQGEVFYSCDWSRARKPNTSILVFAGDSGHIRLITFHPNGGQEQAVLGSHPHAVNDVKVDRKDPEIVATGAADHSLRLWNVEKRILIAIFGGAEGPRNQVVSVSFHDHFPIVAGTGIDHTIHFWDLGTEELKTKIAASKTYSMHQYTFRPVLQHMPKWVTRDIHSNFVDCIAFWGDWVITRSVNEDIILWRCGRDGEHLMELKYEIFNENLNVPPAVPPEWMQQPSPIPRRLTGLSQAAENYVPEHADRNSRGQKKKQPTAAKKRQSKRTGTEDGGDVDEQDIQEIITTIKTRSRTSLNEGGEGQASTSASSVVTRASKITAKGEGESKRPSTRRSASASTSTSTCDSSTGRKSTISSSQVNKTSNVEDIKSCKSVSRSNNYVNDGQKPCGSKDHLRLEGLVTNGSDAANEDGAKGQQQKSTSSSSSNSSNAGPKNSKINIGPDVQLCKKFLVKNSSSWFLRFGIDYEHKLLGFGNEVGDYSVFYLGQWKDQEALTGTEATAFRQVREMKIPVFPEIANRYVRQVAFNYTGQLMVGVTDRCHVVLYRITVHELPKAGKKAPGEGPDGVQRIFAKARGAAATRAAEAAKSAATAASSAKTFVISSTKVVEVIELDDENSS